VNLTIPHRLLGPLLRCGLVLLLAIQGAAAPLRATAQQPAPAASAQPAASEASKHQTDSQEEQGDNAYRHSALVKSAARMLHLPVEATARGFEILNFAVVFFGIGIPLYRFLPKYLRNRAEKVSSDIESARKVTEDANTRLSAVEAKLAHLDEEISKFRAEMEAEMHADESRIKAALEEESARIVASAEQEIGVAAAQARRGLRHFAAELAIDQAAKQIVLTPEADRGLIAEFVSDVSKGGMN
jgi:F-type H+-transporting ATPase subunit b